MYLYMSNVWHPFNTVYDEPLKIKKANGLEIISESGDVYWDMISSWWLNIHGHCDSRISEAMAKQSQKIDQVVYSDTQHPLAEQLVGMLSNFLPKHLNNFFFSDNGSTAIETALKIAIQYWYILGKPNKKIVAFQNCYHGDTFGAMSCSSMFSRPFEKHCMHVDKMPYPCTTDKNYEDKERFALDQFRDYLHKNEVGCAIIEPLIRGASGMKICKESFLHGVLSLCKEFGVISIFDEVMTGFGRTGNMFVCSHEISPDIVCMAKSITGGMLPMGLTAISQNIRNKFMSFDTQFLHGHSYYANPISCAAAIASLKIFEQENVLKKIKDIEKTHKDLVSSLKMVSNPRYCGTISAFDLCLNCEYGSETQSKIKNKFRQKNLIIRPIGNTVYFMPPYCISLEQLSKSYQYAQEAIFEINQEQEKKSKVILSYL